MTVKIANLQQGTDEWKAYRAKHRNASEAPVMMGLSPNTSRSELLRTCFDGSEKEFSKFVQEKVFTNGHEVEAAARPIAIEIVGDDLFSATASDDNGWLSASFDGLTMCETVIWECKQFNKEKAQTVDEGGCPACDYPQVQQQLLVSGAEKCLYMVTDGTKENTRTTWVLPDPDFQKRIIAGWKQFEADLENYEPPADAPEAIGAKMSALPALNIEVEGKVLATNLDQFKSKALEVFDSISTDLSTDQDFADAEETVKWCKGVEEKLEAAKAQALGQTASLDDLFKAIDEVRETARQKRLSLDKLVKSRKEQGRYEIRIEAEKKLAEHVANLNNRLGANFIEYRADFAGAMKGKRTMSSLRDAVDTELASAKIDTSQTADEIQINLKTLDGLVGDDRRLFPDLKEIAHKPSDDFEAVVKMRIAEDEKAQAERDRRKAEAEREIEARRQAEENEQARAAGQTPARPDPEPTKVDSAPAPKHEASKELRFIATFSVQVKESTDPKEAANRLFNKLRSAGFPSAISVEVAEAETA